ncbi:hypothetical protein JCGZ_13138 [Jatropha curcas]|uniref:Uncharacterized protein n=1 Tax=Jatropha curcas TaxID=180498 RepID=A0A067KC40_JATCU|nr:hypothetical protein JCGZ_13138 [Jatropha curcas]
MAFFRRKAHRFVDFRCWRWSRSTPLLHMNISPPSICDFALVLMNHHGRRLEGGCGGRSGQTSHWLNKLMADLDSSRKLELGGGDLTIFWAV